MSICNVYITTKILKYCLFEQSAKVIYFAEKSKLSNIYISISYIKTPIQFFSNRIKKTSATNLNHTNRKVAFFDY